MHEYTIRKLLGIPEYKVSKVESKETELHVWLVAYQRKRAMCSGCGKLHIQGYHSSKESVVEDSPMSGQRVYLHVEKRRYRCPGDGRIYTEQIDWISRYARVTKRYAKQINRLTAITTNQEAGWYLGLDDETVYRVDKGALEELAKERLFPPPAAADISVDEVSYLKYHRYLTNVIDVQKKRVIWNGKGRKAEVLDQYYLAIGRKNCENIQTVALDGARTYISSTTRYAVNALIVLDRFHATQKVNQAIDRVRKDELIKARRNKDEELIELSNCKQRFILLKRKSRLTEKQTSVLQRLCVLNEPIYKALLLKEDFLQVYACANEQEAKEHLIKWIEEAFDSSLDAFVELAQSVLDKAQYILNWFKKQISSAISEGFNNKIKRLKRMAYGYRDIEYFKLKIHQHCGLLNPRIAT
jgi:transposase